MKLVDQFIHFGDNISSTENDVKISVEKALTAIEKSSFIKKGISSSLLLCEYYPMNAQPRRSIYTLVKRSIGTRRECYVPIVEAAPNKTTDVRPLTSHHRKHPSRLKRYARHC